VAFRLGGKCAAETGRRRDEHVNATDSLRLRKKRGDAIGKCRHQITKKSASIVRRSGKAMSKACGRARELLRVAAAQFDLLARDTASPHAGFESLHVSGGGASQGCGRHG